MQITPRHCIYNFFFNRNYEIIICLPLEPLQKVDKTPSGYPVNCCYPLAHLQGLTHSSTRVSSQLAHLPVFACLLSRYSAFPHCVCVCLCVCVCVCVCVCAALWPS